MNSKQSQQSVGMEIVWCGRECAEGFARLTANAAKGVAFEVKSHDIIVVQMGLCGFPGI